MQRFESLSRRYRDLKLFGAALGLAGVGGCIEGYAANSDPTTVGSLVVAAVGAIVYQYNSDRLDSLDDPHILWSVEAAFTKTPPVNDLADLADDLANDLATSGDTMDAILYSLVENYVPPAILSV